MSDKETIKTILKRLDDIEKKHQEFVNAVASDYSKILFKIDGLEKQITAIGLEKVAAAPHPKPEDPETLPGAGDMDQFKPETFEGKPEKITAKEPSKEIKDKSEGLFDDGIKLTDEQLKELEEPDEDFEDEEDEGI